MVPTLGVRKTEARTCTAGGGHTAGSRPGWDGNQGLGDITASLATPRDLWGGLLLPLGTPSGANIPRCKELCPSLGSPQTTTNPHCQHLRE